MRLRHVENGFDILNKHPKVITKPEKYNKKITNFFNNNNPIHIELGSGKGKFLTEMANLYPNINYFGFEKDTKVIYRWIRKINKDCPDNYYIIHSNADMLLEIFEEKSIERIYLNFSDPWPKPRHHKRRLTDKQFLDLYEVVLKKQGELHFKTDNNDLFDFSLLQLKENGWQIKLATRDLHKSNYVEDNVMTEYEEKFVIEGKNINKLVAFKK